MAKGTDPQALMTLGPFAGVDTSTDPYYVDPTKATDANWIVPNRRYQGYSSGRGRVRYGSTSLPAEPYTVFRSVDAVGLFFVALCQQQIWYWRPGQTATTLALPTGTVLQGVGQFVAARLWIFLSTNGPYDTPIKIKYDTKVVTNWGIVPPGVAPTVTPTGTGVLSFADYQYAVTFGVQIGGTTIQESTPGPFSPILAITNQQAALTAIPISSDPQVNQRNIYRIDSGGTPRLITELNDNTTTTYTDNTADTLVTGQDLITNRDPPKNFFATEFHQDSVWGFGYYGTLVPGAGAATQSDILWTNQSEPWGFNLLTQFLPAGENAGSDIAVGLASTGNVLLMLKTKTAWGVFGDSTNDYYVQKLFDIGCCAPLSIAKAQGVSFWLSPQGVYAFDGSAPQYLSRDIKTWLDNNQNALSTAVGGYADRCYLLSFPVAGITWQYDTVTQAWFKLPISCNYMSYSPDAFGSQAVVSTGVLETEMGAVLVNESGFDLGYSFNELLMAPTIVTGDGDGNILQWFSAETDLGQPIVSSWVTGISDSGAPEATKQYRKLVILAAPQAGVLTVTVTVDPGPSQKQISRPINLLTAPQAKVISLPAYMKGRTVQIGLAASSTSGINIQRATLFGWIDRRLVVRG